MRGGRTPSVLRSSAPSPAPTLPQASPGGRLSFFLPFFFFFPFLLFPYFFFHSTPPTPPFLFPSLSFPSQRSPGKHPHPPWPAQGEAGTPGTGSGQGGQPGAGGEQARPVSGETVPVPCGAGRGVPGAEELSRCPPRGCRDRARAGSACSWGRVGSKKFERKKKKERERERERASMLASASVVRS